MCVERHGLQRDVSRSSRIARFILSKGLQLPGCSTYLGKPAQLIQAAASEISGKTHIYSRLRRGPMVIHNMHQHAPTRLCHDAFRCANVCIRPGNQFLAAPPHLIANSASA